MKTILACWLLFGGLASANMDLLTTGERSGWLRTGRAVEAQKLCESFQRRFPARVRCRSYGTTPENRSMPYLIVGDDGAPTVWVQAGIHAGEIDGKDAVFYLLKEVLEKRIKPDPIRGLRLVFIPIVNLDGHERFGAWNRPNQVGPEEMGWRTTAQNLNLNRDFMKADAPEMQALLKLWHKMNPVLSLDLHVTNGAQFQPEVGLIVHPVVQYGSTPLHAAGSEFETALLKKMAARQHVALPFYPDFEDASDPLSGFSRYVSTLRFAHGYWQANNRLGMLVETHSWKDYATRVKAHISTVLSSLELAQIHAKDWAKISASADESILAGTTVELGYEHTKKSTTITFPGYEFTKMKSKISGADVLKYNPKIGQDWIVPFYEELRPTLQVTAPRLGYFVRAADAAWILPRLAAHGIKTKPWKQALPPETQVFRASKTTFSATPSEGHQTLVVEGEWRVEEPVDAKDFVLVPIVQPRARLIVEFFEPRAKDSFVSWGFFNTAFEKKEYMEDYVAEDVALEMLKNPAVKAEFEKKLEEEAFAKDPQARFDFFYRKHPSWDERFNKYPVLKN
jgi:hypothetical protein